MQDFLPLYIAVQKCYVQRYVHLCRYSAENYIHVLPPEYNNYSLTSPTVWPKEAEYSLLHRHGPANLVPHSERRLCHFSHQHCTQ